MDKMLGSIGLDRTQVRIINAVPWRPPGNRTPTESEIALCLPFLHRQIALIGPSLLFSLGAVAAKAMLGPQAQGGITRLRGKWQQVSIEGLPAPLRLLPSYHPAYLLRTPIAKRAAWHDLLSLRDQLQTHN
ncbi:uracil-DNA glycosylase [Acidocella sp. MX-AZ02]|nr:uracil-DNA glycosylase [Acidocella sp. MX-AZ02]